MLRPFVDFLRQVDHDKCITCAVHVNALPTETPTKFLAAAGYDANQFKDSPEFQQEVLLIQQDLGLAPATGGVRQAGGLR